MARKLRGSTVVVTGASSGIGRETALEFAKCGAHVVIAGRREERLHELVAKIERRGAAALAVRTDVAEQSQVDALIETAVQEFGRIDVLVNNAGVGISAKFADQSLQDFQRVMDVNFWGAVYACKAVLPHMQRQTGGGVIINVSSILGKRGMPFQTAYCASKFALAGFAESLRTEVMSEEIYVTTIFPGSVDTEIYETSANQTGMEFTDYFPKFPARGIAKAIVLAARFPVPQVVLPLDAVAIDTFNRLAPGMMDLAFGWMFPFLERALYDTSNGSDEVRHRSGNLYRPG